MVPAVLKGLLIRHHGASSTWTRRSRVGDVVVVAVGPAVEQLLVSVHAVQPRSRHRQRPLLIVDETGFLKKGRGSAGVQRQHTGTAGRIENSQVGVFLAYASHHGRALIDRRLYLPEQAWGQDGERRAGAGVPDHVEFATKPALTGRMIEAALDAGITTSWATGDESYGPGLRALLEARRIDYVLAVACSTRVRINIARRRGPSTGSPLPAIKALEEFDVIHLRGMTRQQLAHLGTLNFPEFSLVITPKVMDGIQVRRSLLPEDRFTCLFPDAVQLSCSWRVRP